MTRFAAFSLLVCCAQEFPVLMTEDFEKGAERWEFSDPKTWKVIDSDKGKVLSLFEKTNPKTPHRSPFGRALLKDMIVGDFVMEADVQSTVKDSPHRDLCLFFGYQDPDHFYYSHLGKTTDKHANQLFIVNGADRMMISTKTTEGTNWDDDWHHVKVVRKTADGTIEIYLDDLKTPVQTATNKTFLWGQVGVGSFATWAISTTSCSGGPRWLRRRSKQRQNVPSVLSWVLFQNVAGFIGRPASRDEERLNSLDTLRGSGVK